MSSYAKSLAGTVSLIRVHNLIGLALLALASIAWSGKSYNVYEAIAFSLGFVCIAAAGYAWNDLRDQPIDRLNRPTRPLVSRSVTPRVAYLVSAMGGLIGTLLMAKFGTMGIVAALVTIGALFFYSLSLKNNAGFVGNLVVAVCVAEIPLLAGMLAGDVWRMVPLVATNFGLMLMREVLKDLEDDLGDQLGERRTLASVSPQAVTTVLVASSVIAALGEVGTARLATFWLWRAIQLVLVLLTLIAALRRRSNPSSLRLTQRTIRVLAFVFALTVLIAGVSGTVKG